jgi:hypothetical protein
LVVLDLAADPSNAVVSVLPLPAAIVSIAVEGTIGYAASKDGGVMLLAAAERRLRLAERLAAVICDPRDPNRVTHAMADILRARIFAIACGYEDANDLDRLRCDPAFKLACGRLPDTGLDLCSQPTLSRAENLPDLRTVIRLGEALVDLWLSSYAAPPESVTLDIDDTLDVVHGHQQLSLFNAHYDERCFLPIHIYDAAPGRHHPASGEDPDGQRDTRTSAPPRPAYPPPLADHPRPVPRRWPLWQGGGHEVVRGQRCRLRLRTAREPGPPASRP